MSRRIARLIPCFSYDDSRYFNSDGAPAEIAEKRRQGMNNLRNQVMTKSPKTVAFGASLEDTISDVRFTSAYRVPFPFREHLHKELKAGSIVEESKGVQIRNLDGHWSYDVSGSYGVNVFGYDFYKDCMEQGFARVKQLGPVLGPYHPLIRENVEKLKAISGLDEVSFHMSGTEAVMQAVRLALMRRLSRLVGRRAARHRQSTQDARCLYPERHEQCHPQGSRNPQGHCLCPDQPIAGTASKRRRFERRLTGEQRTLRQFQ